MTNAEYHAYEAVSKSDLDLIHRSPLHYVTAKQSSKIQTEAMLIGSVTHKLVLEPEGFEQEYAVAPECNRRTKEGKSAWNDFIEKSDGKIIVPDALYIKAQSIAEAVRNNSIVKKLLVGGKAEQSFFWNEDGIKCKCRPDYLRNDGICIDFKTTQDSSKDYFTKSAYNFRYHVQAWWYMHGLQANGINVNNFIFIAAEKEPPYAVCVYAVDDLILQLGEIEALEDLRVYKDCMKTGVWHGYEKTPKIHSLSLPDWVARKEL